MTASDKIYREKILEEMAVNNPTSAFIRNLNEIHDIRFLSIIHINFWSFI